MMITKQGTPKASPKRTFLGDFPFSSMIEHVSSSSIQPNLPKISIQSQDTMVNLTTFFDTFFKQKVLSTNLHIYKLVEILLSRRRNSLKKNI